MKKHIIYTITVICIILTATTLVTGKNITDKTNVVYATQMKQTESLGKSRRLCRFVRPKKKRD